MMYRIFGRSSPRAAVAAARNEQKETKEAKRRARRGMLCLVLEDRFIANYCSLSVTSSGHQFNRLCALVKPNRRVRSRLEQHKAALQPLLSCAGCRRGPCAGFRPTANARKA